MTNPNSTEMKPTEANNKLMEAKEFLLRKFTTKGFHLGKETVTLEIEIMSDKIAKVMCEFSELYLSRTLEEGAKELPDDYIITKEAHSRKITDIEYSGRLWGMEWMKDKASLLLASLNSKLEAKDKEIEKLNNLVRIEGEDADELVKECDGLKSQLEAKDSLIQDKDIVIANMNELSVKKNNEISELKLLLSQQQPVKGYTEEQIEIVMNKTLLWAGDDEDGRSFKKVKEEIISSLTPSSTDKGDKKSAEEILMKIFNSEDSEDLQMSITLNPQLKYFTDAMEEYADQFRISSPKESGNMQRDSKEAVDTNRMNRNTSENINNP